MGGKMKNGVLKYSRLVLACLTLAFVDASTPCQGMISQVPRDEQGKIKLDVPYEPSSDKVVTTMLEIANVGKNDLVYDLGCGDGRIVIAAAQKAGAHGVGVDLDPERIKESLENAHKAKVIDRVTFFQQDLFQTDIGKATVVMLYLWPEVNLKLRPKLLRELKPGTRVVSHSHTMENWEPDQTMTAPDGHRVYFWVIPANATGAWEWNMPREEERCILKISQQFQKVSGRLQVGLNEVPVKDLELRGDRIQFAVERLFKGQMQVLRFMGRVRENLIEGTVEEMTAGPQRKQGWKAKRDPSSMKPLD